MTLDRKNSKDGKGKYSLVLNRKVAGLGVKEASRVRGALKTLEKYGVLDHGIDEEREFFVMRLSDINAAPALAEYAKQASNGGEKEFGHAVFELSARSFRHPNRRRQT